MLTIDELDGAGGSMTLNPLSAFRAQSSADLKVNKNLREEGTQQSVIGIMQPRMELYDYLGYHDYEEKLDNLFDHKHS